MIVNRLPLSFAFVLPLVFAACGGDGLTLPPEGEAAHITVIEGSPQSGPVGSTLDTLLLVQVTDTRNQPVAGATVVFSFPNATDGEAAPTSATTDSEGRTSSTLTLGSTPGTVTGKVAVPVDAGIRPVEAPFTVTAVSDDAAGIAYVSGDGQSAPVNSTLPAPLVVQVTDRFGNPIPDVTISWTFTGGGSVSEASTVTGPNGQASVTRTLGGAAGQQTTLATVDGLGGSPVTFTHTATAGSATGVVKVSGDGQSALVGTELTDPLVVQVLDGQGNPIPNRPVTWVTGDGSVNPQNTTTDAQGFASTRWTLGLTPGAKTANAVVSGLQAATFNATATAGSPSGSTSTVSASPETITAGGTSTITVTVRDASNNPISGVSVALSSSGTGNSITPGSASSGADGVATFTFSSTVAEAKTIAATAGGVTIDDQATVDVQRATSIIEIQSDDPDPSLPTQAVTVEFSVRGGGTQPTGTVTVTVSEGTETCNAVVTNGSGSCDITLLAPGLQSNRRRVLTATYSGDERFSGDSDTENHVVNPVPPANNPPTAAFTEPSCTAGQSCQFNDGSSDSDGSIASRLWGFQDGTPASSGDANPSVTFASEGSKTVTLTVTDDDGASNGVTKSVTVSPANVPPTATDDSYSTPTDTPLNEASGSLTANDSPPEAGDVYSTSLSSSATTPGGGQVSVDSDGSFSYTPAAGFTGPDTFEYTLSDGRGGTDTATVTITVGTVGS